MLAPAAALQAVFDSPGVKGSSRFARFPRRITKQPCAISGSGSAAGTTASGVCAIAVQVRGALDAVQFIEGWDARDFHAATDPARGWLTHTWTFLVNAQGKIVTQTETGSAPPREVK